MGTAILLFAASSPADDWPQWRGPAGNGVSAESGLPSRWSEEENIAWKAPLGGLGVSNPIVWGDRIFVTSQIGKGALRPGGHPTLARSDDAPREAPLGAFSPGGHQRVEEVSFLVEAFHRADGRRLWSFEIDAEGMLPQVHRKHNLASPSPVTDGELVFAWFATGQLVALDMDGTPVWQRNLAEDSPFEVSWGHAASPTLFGDSLFLLCDHGPAAYLLAVDRRTGEDQWRVDRGEGLRSYATPFVASGPEGNELIVNSSHRVDAYDPVSGESLWHFGTDNRFPVPSPSFADGILYMSRGYRSGPYMAVRTGGRGDIGDTHVLWRVETGAPYISSLVHYRGLVYMANGNGVVTIIDGENGEKLAQERIGGVFTASPVAGDGKVYLLDESGEMFVLRAGREIDIEARNSIDERSIASPAISGGQIFLRTDQHLIRVGQD